MGENLLFYLFILLNENGLHYIFKIYYCINTTIFKNLYTYIYISTYANYKDIQKSRYKCNAFSLVQFSNVINSTEFNVKLFIYDVLVFEEVVFFHFMIPF